MVASGWLTILTGRRLLPRGYLRRRQRWPKFVYNSWRRSFAARSRPHASVSHCLLSAHDRSTLPTTL